MQPTYYHHEPLRTFSTPTMQSRHIAIRPSTILMLCISFVVATFASAQSTEPKPSNKREPHLQKAVTEMVPLVEKYSGLKFSASPKVRATTHKEWRNIVKRETGIEDSSKLLAMCLQLFGLYLPKSKEIALSPLVVGPLTKDLDKDSTRYAQNAVAQHKLTVAHEMVHALQEEHFGLPSKLDATEEFDEIRRYKFLMEGHAVFIEELIAEREFGLEDWMAKGPYHGIVTEPSYVFGRRYFLHVLHDEGMVGVHAKLRKPTTYRQMLELSREKLPLAPAKQATRSPSVATTDIAPLRKVVITKLKNRLRIEFGEESQEQRQLFTEYRFSGGPRPFFYPVIGAAERRATRMWPMEEGDETEARDHIHHRSLWFTHGAVNGIDFWTEKKGNGVIVHDGFDEITSGEEGVIRCRNLWKSTTGDVILRDERTYRIRFEMGGPVLDHEITLRASESELLLGDTKEGTMAIRLHPQLRLTGKVAQGECITSEGIEGRKAWGKRSRWIDYHGPVDGVVVGVAILDHPENLRHPTWWHARHYGLFAANPFGIHDFEGKPRGSGDLKIPKGESLTLRHRFLFHPGDEKQAKISERFKEYATPRKAAAPDKADKR